MPRPIQWGRACARHGGYCDGVSSLSESEYRHHQSVFDFAPDRQTAIDWKNFLRHIGRRGGLGHRPYFSITSGLRMTASDAKPTLHRLRLVRGGYEIAMISSS